MCETVRQRSFADIYRRHAGIPSHGLQLRTGLTTLQRHGPHSLTQSAIGYLLARWLADSRNLPRRLGATFPSVETLGSLRPCLTPSDVSTGAADSNLCFGRFDGRPPIRVRGLFASLRAPVLEQGDNACGRQASSGVLVSGAQREKRPVSLGGLSRWSCSLSASHTSTKRQPGWRSPAPTPICV